MKQPAAAVTMVYNEPDMLPLWTGYYAKQFGAASCYVVDHGTDDGSTAGQAVNVLRIPRSPMDDVKRAHFISLLCSSLLEWYETVVYTDVDEFLVPDPGRYASLLDYCARSAQPVSTAIGLDVQYLPGASPHLQISAPILRQRPFARFNFALCKPLVTKLPIHWSPGFHSCEHATAFDGLFLFHLHHFDLPAALRRLEKTRNMPWRDHRAGQHQRVNDVQYEEMINAVARLPRVEDATFDDTDPNLSRYTDWILKFVEQNPERRGHFYFDNGVSCSELLRIPERFLDLI